MSTSPGGLRKQISGSDMHHLMKQAWEFAFLKYCKVLAGAAETLEPVFGKELLQEIEHTCPTPQLNHNIPFSMLVIRMHFLNPQPTLTFLRGEALALIYLIVLIFRLFFLGIFHDHKAQFTLFFVLFYRVCVRAVPQ